MKISEKDFLSSQSKAGLLDKVAAHLVKVAEIDKIEMEKAKKQGVKITFKLSPTGGEIHSGESMVDRLNKPESLREKIARFDRLAQRVMQSRVHMQTMYDEMAGEDDPEDFDFIDGPDVDDFGDQINVPTVKPSEEIIEPIAPAEPEPVAKKTDTGEPVSE